MLRLHESKITDTNKLAINVQLSDILGHLIHLTHSIDGARDLVITLVPEPMELNEGAIIGEPSIHFVLIKNDLTIYNTMFAASLGASFAQGGKFYWSAGLKSLFILSSSSILDIEFYSFFMWLLSKIIIADVTSVVQYILHWRLIHLLTSSISSIIALEEKGISSAISRPRSSMIASGHNSNAGGDVRLAQCNDGHGSMVSAFHIANMITWLASQANFNLF